MRPSKECQELYKGAPMIYRNIENLIADFQPQVEAMQKQKHTLSQNLVDLLFSAFIVGVMTPIDFNSNFNRKHVSGPPVFEGGDA